MVLSIRSAVTENVLQSKKHLLNWPLSQEAKSWSGFPVADTLALVSLHCHTDCLQLDTGQLLCDLR